MTATPALELAPVPLRLVPAPASAPPYDDEPGAPVLRLGRAATPPPAPGGAGAPPPPPPVDEEACLAAERPPTAQLPASHLFARRLLQGVLEVLAGVRSVK